MPSVSRVIMSSIKKQFGNRKFYALPEDYALKSAKYRSTSLKKEETAKLVKYIDENVIGKHTTFAGPYGRRKVVYCDYTASGRSLQFIEDYIIREVLPVYGNTHTTTSITSMQSTLLRHEARDIIRNAVHASEDDVVIFAGNGSTAAVHKLIHGLALMESPVVFVGPCEHHSNLLPWRELQAKIVRISETKEGFLDLVDLENQLQLHRQLEGPDRQLIGCFSAASNITGILADDIATTLLLHQYNALAFWDYATAAPYTQLDMNPILPGVNEKSVYKDAIFFSGHKFVGGVQTPGILVAKKKVFVNPVPETCGGGTVFFVTHNSHCYLKDTELREEGGTAGIVESIRMGLVMQLKQTVGVAGITAREDKLTKMVLSHMRNIPEVILLGNSTHGVKRLAVFSFLVRHPRGTYLHHNFVCAILNDVFGVQVRGGCACAGPYAQDLLGIDQDLAQEYEDILLEDCRLDRRHLRRKEEHSSYEMLRPGFTRISLPYFMPDSDVAYVLEAIKMVATEGWKLLPQYILNPETGEWRHHTNSVYKERKWLGSIRYIDGKMTVNERRISSVAACPADHSDCLQTARNIFNKARKMAQRYPLTDHSVMFDERAARLRWFMLPSEAQDLLLGNSQNVKQTVPFTPAEYCGSRGGVSPPLCPSTPPTPILTPFARHNSLSALDIKARNTQERSDSQSPSPAPNLATRGSMPQLPFSLGVRERCYSLGSSKQTGTTKTSPIPISSYHPCITRQRQISCGSQTDLSQNGNDSSVTGDCTDSRGATPPNSISENAEQIQAYVQELTKELATEIKSEIREVINKVEDVLSESADSLETNASLTDKRYSIDVQQQHLLQHNQQIQMLQQFPVYNSPPTNFYQPFQQPQSHFQCIHPNLANQMNYQPLSLSPVSSFSAIQSQPPQSLSPMPSANTNDSVSVNHVAEYLAELTSDVVSEVKSEFREMVSAVDELISPNSEISKQMSESSIDYGDKNNKCCFFKRNSIAECTNIHNNNNNIINSNDGLKSIAENKIEEGSAYCNHLMKDNRRSTLNSISSQDSGINLTYHDRDSSASPSDCSMKNSSDGSRCRQFLSPIDKVQFQNNSVEDRKSNGEDMNDGILFRAVKKVKWYCPPKNIWKPTMEAIKEFNMLHDGDSVMVCLSGGKDSLSLLHTLRQYQFYARSKGIEFRIGAATVDPGSSAYDPRPLIPYLKELGVHYLYEEQQILDQATKAECKSICSFCSRMKRGRLYAAARQHNYNVLALGQHLDDLAESFLMSTFHNGRLRSMKAHYVIREKDLRVIRPFVYVREKALRQFAESRDLPIIPENCPACFEAPKERHRTKQLLAQQEILFPRLFLSLRSALKPLISFNKTGDESHAYNHSNLGPVFTDDNDDDDDDDDDTHLHGNIDRNENESETEEEPVSVISDKSTHNG